MSRHKPIQNTLATKKLTFRPKPIPNCITAKSINIKNDDCPNKIQLVQEQDCSFSIYSNNQRIFSVDSNGAIVRDSLDIQIAGETTTIDKYYPEVNIYSVDRSSVVNLPLSDSLNVGTSMAVNSVGTEAVILRADDTGGFVDESIGLLSPGGIQEIFSISLPPGSSAILTSSIIGGTGFWKTPNISAYQRTIRPIRQVVTSDPTFSTSTSKNAFNRKTLIVYQKNAGGIYVKEGTKKSKMDAEGGYNFSPEYLVAAESNAIVSKTITLPSGNQGLFYWTDLNELKYTETTDPNNIDTWLAPITIDNDVQLEKMKPFVIQGGTYAGYPAVIYYYVTSLSIRGYYYNGAVWEPMLSEDFGNDFFPPGTITSSVGFQLTNNGSNYVIAAAVSGMNEGLYLQQTFDFGTDNFDHYQKVPGLDKPVTFAFNASRTNPGVFNIGTLSTSNKQNASFTTSPFAPFYSFAGSSSTVYEPQNIAYNQFLSSPGSFSTDTVLIPETIQTVEYRDPVTTVNEIAEAVLDSLSVYIGGLADLTNMDITGDQGTIKTTNVSNKSTSDKNDSVDINEVLNGIDVVFKVLANGPVIIFDEVVQKTGVIKEISDFFDTLFE